MEFDCDSLSEPDVTCSYSSLARALNNYAGIIKLKEDLESPYYPFPMIRKATAEKLMPLLNDFEMNVPEKTRKRLEINPEQIKKRCLEVLADK